MSYFQSLGKYLSSSCSPCGSVPGHIMGQHLCILEWGWSSSPPPIIRLGLSFYLYKTATKSGQLLTKGSLCREILQHPKLFLCQPTECHGSRCRRAKEPWHDVWLSGASWKLRGIGIMQRPLSSTTQQMGNPGQKQHWVLSPLSQRCPHSSTAFEDGDPFTFENQDVTPNNALTIPILSHRA